MAHFAKLDENNIVLEVNVVHNNELLDENGQESEAKGIAFLTAWSGGYTRWKQTSYNRKFRKNYAGVGFVYDETRDAFIGPQPYPSWVLNDKAQWESPIPMPSDANIEKSYTWNETTQQWVLKTT